MQIRTITPCFVDSAPPQLEIGVLYISIRFKTALHLCCCGCGAEVVTPFSPAKWMLLFHGPSVSLYPSIGNWSTCRAHYIIRENRVIKARQYAQWEIDATQARDDAALKRHYGDSEPDGGKRSKWWDRLFGE